MGLSDDVDREQLHLVCLVSLWLCSGGGTGLADPASAGPIFFMSARPIYSDLLLHNCVTISVALDISCACAVIFID